MLAEERPDNVGYRTFRHANPCNTGVRLLSLPSTENPYHRMLKTPRDGTCDTSLGQVPRGRTQWR